MRVNPGITSVFQGEAMIILQGQFRPVRCMHNEKANRNIIALHTGTNTHTHTLKLVFHSRFSTKGDGPRKKIQFDL